MSLISLNSLNIIVLMYSAVDNKSYKISFVLCSGGDMERAAPEAHLLRPVRSHHRLDALQGEACHTVCIVSSSFYSLSSSFFLCFSSLALSILSPALSFSVSPL